MDPLILCGAIVAAQQIIAAASLIFNNIPTQHEVRVEKKRKREVAPYKRNVSVRSGPPETMLEPVRVLEGLLQDDNHEYLRKITHLHSWQFFLLTDRLKDLILRPRDNKQSAKVGPAVKHDHHHRLFFALKWLNDGNFHRTREADFGWSKTSLQRDLEHVLRAIVEGLDDELQWPGADRRAELANVYPGIFHGCIGVGDVKEFQVVKFQDPVKERHSFSGKKKINSYKFFSVMDHSGRFIYARLCLGANDREVYTSSPLYLQEGNYFSEDEFVAVDGGFEGDGHLRCSYKNPGQDEIKKLFNLTWQEVRMGVENSYARVGTWFPLLGNNKKKLNHSENILMLAVQAAVRLHNFIMNTEQLSYAAYESPEMHFSEYY